MSSAGPLLVHRLLPACRHRDTLVKLIKSRQQIRTFSIHRVRYNENERDGSDPSPLNTNLPLLRRRRALSPLERVSRLLPQDALTPEVMQLRGQSQQEPEEDPDIQEEEEEEEEKGTGKAADEGGGSPGPEEAPMLPGERPITFGELLMAEHIKKRKKEMMRKMFKLQEGGRLHSNWGVILHDHIAGRPTGHYLNSSRGSPFFIRRADLEDYVLHMRRAPCIIGPSDASTMITMMGVSEGDCVLDSGSGSGAMALFLSRAVGSRGSVLSLDIREDHLQRATLNYQCWRASWRLRRGEDWPDNVQFHHADLRTASSLLTGRGFHSVCLDMPDPQLVLPTVLPHLHHGAVCTVYLVNITQITDLLEGIRCLALPLLCEQIVEVPIRQWTVVAAVVKNKKYCVRNAPVLNGDQREETEEQEDGEETSEEEDEGRNPAFGSIPYIAKPHHIQSSHGAFLVKLRKYVP